MPALPSRDLEHVLAHSGNVWQSLAGSRVFITGGTGFVGTWLVESLLHATDRLNLGISATVLTRDAQRYYETNPSAAQHPAIQVLQGDVLTFEYPPGEFPFVIHAAMPDPAPEADAEGMRHILEFAATHGTVRFLFTSSGAIYGRQPPELTHIPEDHAIEPPVTGEITAYGMAKRVSESLLVEYGNQHGFAALIARLFAFTGPRLPLDANFAAGNFIRDTLAGGPIRIQGDGTPYRSYLYAADLAVWLGTILVHGKACRPYNVGSGQAVTIAELAGVVAEATVPGTPVEIAQTPVPEAPAMRYVPSVERAERELGLRPAIALEEGVRRMYEWAKGPK
jgi:nucleoside-diphosphate-sugar epimerase